MVACGSQIFLLRSGPKRGGMRGFYSGVLALALSSRGCEAIVATLPWRRMERSGWNARQSVAVQAAIAPDPASEGDDDVGRSPPSQQPPPRPPAVVSQATTPLWVTSASPPFAEGASGLWEVLCMPPIQEAFRISDHLPEDAGLKMSQSMIKGGWRNLTCVWEADKSAPKLQALWRLCGHCPTPQVQAVVYAFVKASFDVRCRALPLSVLPSLSSPPIPRKPPKSVPSPPPTPAASEDNLCR